MADDRRYGIQLKVRIPKKLRDDLKRLCEMRGTKMQRFVWAAVEDAMARESRLAAAEAGTKLYNR